MLKSTLIGFGASERSWSEQSWDWRVVHYFGTVKNPTLLSREHIFCPIISTHVFPHSQLFKIPYCQI